MENKAKVLSYLALIQAVVATVGSLYFSEVLQLPPCSLCWYQRAFMYPLPFILAVGILRQDKNLPFYVLPLAFVGLAIAAFHNLLYYGVISEAAASCQLGISCTNRFFEWFGFVTIPLLSFLAFGVIFLSMVAIWKLRK